MDYMYIFILMILNIKIDVKYVKLLNVKKGEYIWIYKVIKLIFV